MNKTLFTNFLAIAALLTLVAAMGCPRSSESESGGRGEIIHVGAYEPVKLERVVYALPRYCDEPEESAQSSPVSDLDALIALYTSAGGVDWENSDKWLSDAPLGEWHGVTTNDNGSITAISLPNNDLAGVLPTELGGLSNLASLDITGNGGLTGCVPAALRNVSIHGFIEAGLNQNYVIAPQQEGYVIAAVRARVLNPESTQVTLSVDEKAATLRDLNDTQYKLIDPSPGQGAVETQEEAPEDNPYAARIWGEFQVIVGFEIPGWLFFETPEALDFSALVWEDVEFVRVRYPKKN